MRLGRLQGVEMVLTITSLDWLLKAGDSRLCRGPLVCFAIAG
jgi:hypothetical protein